MNALLNGDGNVGKFDQLALERAILSLCRVGIRPPPLSVERTKAWIKQFDSECEKTLAWLILRHLVYRTGLQLESCLRQALKEAAMHFLRSSTAGHNADWREALAGKVPGLSFYCGPPTVDGISKPGKSGEVVTRLVSRVYKIEKYYPHDVRILGADERYLVVDDGAYTGQQLTMFLEGWRDDYSDGKVALVVGLAHQQALKALKKRFPTVPFFYGELLTEKNSLNSLSARWIADGQWLHSGNSPLDVYLDIFQRKGPFSQVAPQGFGSLGLSVAFEHGIPDDSLQLLWDKSPNWIPLMER